MISGDLGNVVKERPQKIGRRSGMPLMMLNTMIKSLESKYLNPGLVGSLLPTNWEKNPNKNSLVELNHNDINELGAMSVRKGGDFDAISQFN
jgi:hypothetical protein